MSETLAYKYPECPDCTWSMPLGIYYTDGCNCPEDWLKDECRQHPLDFKSAEHYRAYLVDHDREAHVIPCCQAKQLSMI